MFSFGTTVFSAYNSHQEDIRANRRDVRAILQRLSRLPIENYELMQKNKGVGQGEALSGMLNQENILLATQAAELIERYPGSFTSAEFFAVALALNTSNITNKVPSCLLQGGWSAFAALAIHRSAAGVTFWGAVILYLVGAVPVLIASFAVSAVCQGGDLQARQLAFRSGPFRGLQRLAQGAGSRVSVPPEWTDPAPMG